MDEVTRRTLLADAGLSSSPRWTFSLAGQKETCTGRARPPMQVEKISDLIGAKWTRSQSSDVAACCLVKTAQPSRSFAVRRRRIGYLERRAMIEINCGRGTVSRTPTW
jgi:hypothetical protein